ncbi:hypothetical protein COS52_01190 [Candidatus Roizmanbacteria bacterium CG03_land_8_20_14_0_80_39_12]|uniref:Uncharacterized protein n=2 Tax=Candidatus Roizmaniibacteriota TaxID=1752723 RepID=A0A2M7BTD5_9BACT|nr:MAG: hypothetical protein COS52_01190 [Candidatus Roizmanbacteria bacterium CG03_land_8_20_14_0_80_39_12]
MFIPTVNAQCPVCIVTVGGGLFIAKKLGVDDLLTALWISGLNVAISFWFVTFIKKPKFLRNPLLWTAIMFVSTYGYLAATKQMYHKNNTFMHVDKVLVGLVLGTLVWLLGIGIDKLIRKYNNGKVLFFYQKVIVPLFLLLATSGLFAVLIKNIRI